MRANQFFRPLALVLCLMLLLSTLSACGTPTADPSAEASAETTTDEVESSVSEEPPVVSDTPQESTAVSAVEADSATETATAPGAFSLPLCEETETISYWFEMSPMVASYLNTMNDNITYQL